jgi:hypothetical protein
MVAMDTFVGFNANYLEVDVYAFSNEYALAHPNGNNNSFPLLYRKLINVLFECESLIYVHKTKANTKFNKSYFESGKLTWLLCNITFTDFCAQLQSFMIKLNNPNLSDEDYILLFYISLQSQEVQDATQNLPLSMLRDMFSPVAEDNLNRWKLVS